MLEDAELYAFHGHGGDHDLRCTVGELWAAIEEYFTAGYYLAAINGQFEAGRTDITAVHFANRERNDAEAKLRAMLGMESES